jgi:predicted NUDIX family NTP pyrophosphohydrolase
MPKMSAAVLLYRRTTSGGIEILLAHPGGPFWARKDEGAWSLPKGEYEPGEEPLAAAYREFREEVGSDPPAGAPLYLGEVKQPGGKKVVAWALEGDLDVTSASSNTFSMEWPKGSGRVATFPEVDRVEWFATDAAHAKILEGQAPFIDRLLDTLGEG